MAAKNPRWPQKFSVFDIYALQLLESDMIQRTKKLHLNILNMLKNNQVAPTSLE